MKKLKAGAAFAAVAALTCTCDNVVIDGEIPPPLATTPRGVSQLLEYSFNHIDIQSLKACLSENIVFYFDPEEMGRYPGGGYDPPLSYTEFWHAAEHMFQRAYSVSMSISVQGVGEPDPNAPTYKAENVNIKLLVMVTEHSGFLARGYAGFEFEKYRNASGEDRWRITKWWDNTAPGEGEGDPAGPTAGVERASVAAILSYYR